ncbi:MAG: hypothetical protein WA843_02660 [Candidatus Saccharimonadales bacterium]
MLHTRTLTIKVYDPNDPNGIQASKAWKEIFSQEDLGAMMVALQTQSWNARWSVNSPEGSEIHIHTTRDQNPVDVGAEAISLIEQMITDRLTTLISAV